VTDIDTVAEALTRLDIDPLPDGSTYRLTHEDALNMARAAIDALGLTQEWGIRSGVNIARNSMSESNAKAKAAMWPESFEAVSRLAGPWVRVEEQP
jgi:hypothetical protein